MQKDKLTLDEAKQRLLQFPVLAQILGDDWLEREYKKSPKLQNLIAVWMFNKDDDITGKWLESWREDFEIALKALSPPHTSPKTWEKIQHKVRAHSDPENSKGTMSEIAVCRFLIKNQFSIQLDKKLMPSSNKDVDIQVLMSDTDPLNIEVQCVSESDDSKHGADVAASFESGYPMQNDKEIRRIKRKIYDKIPKFTTEDITLVALDFTHSLVPNINGRYSIVREVLDKIFLRKNLSGETTPFYNLDSNIREYVDGVIWFKLAPQKRLGFMPQERGLYINPHSRHQEKIRLSLFTQAWRKNSHKPQ